MKDIKRKFLLAGIPEEEVEKFCEGLKNSMNKHAMADAIIKAYFNKEWEYLKIANFKKKQVNNYGKNKGRNRGKFSRSR